ncbi:MAG: hypothetical protein K2J20_02995 [Bacilli bacterium]|nr:hypothetical protein [Bacilli bacterium]
MTNGGVTLLKKSKASNSTHDYEASYNLYNDSCTFNSSKVSVESSNDFVNIKTHDISVSKLNNGNTIIIHSSKIINNSNFTLQIFLDENTKIVKCIIDFHTYKKVGRNNKINGTYAVRINPTLGTFSIDFISRKGFKTGGFMKDIASDVELYDLMTSKDIQVNDISTIIDKLIPIISCRAVNDNKRPIYPSRVAFIADELSNISRNTANYLKEIKGEIPLPHLVMILENIIKILESEEGLKRTRK